MGLWKEDPDLSYVFARMRMIYSQANALYSPRDERFDYLLFATGDLSRQYRKNKSEFYGIAVAQVFAWFMSLAESFFVEWGGDKLAIAMSEKYPQNSCGYCGKSPCICAEDSRPEHKSGQISLDQLHWSVQQWQEHLHVLYGKSNQTGGVPRALNRLFEEVSEVGLLLHLAEGFGDSRVELEKKIALEMTDVLAWLFATATLLKIDVQKVVSDLYGNSCPICRSPVCACRSFERRPHAGNMSHRFMSADDIAKALIA